MVDKDIEQESPPETNQPKQSALISMNPLDIQAATFSKALTRRKKNREALLDWIRDTLVSGIDYQRIKIKGNWSKPFLSKAGSEKILGMLGVTATFPDLVEQKNKLQEGSEMIVLTCALVNESGQIVGTGAGGRTMEQDKYDVNKCIKMALKSAQIDATLRLGGLSELFTQDEESAQDDVIDRPIGTERAKALTELASQAGMPMEAVCKFYNVESIDMLPESKFLRCKKAITKHIKKAEEPDSGNNDNDK